MRRPVSHVCKISWVGSEKSRLIVDQGASAKLRLTRQGRPSIGCHLGRSR